MARFRLIPRDERFFDFFEKATAIGVDTVDTLHQMLLDFGQAEMYRKRIAELEHDGDDVIHQTMDTVNRTFVTPIDAEDIRAIASRLDNIIDYTQGAAERLVLYQVKSPLPECIELVAVLQRTIRTADKAVHMLRDLSRRTEITTLCIEINSLENAGDKVYREALGYLFRQGDPMELMRWKEIFEEVEQALDECEDLADLIETVVVKHA